MKVLIVSHNVISLDGNMGKTLHAYFQDWKSEDLCQLYFHSQVPTTRLCERYFRITDFDLVKAFRCPGTVLTEADIREGRAASRTDTGAAAWVYQAGRKRAPWMYLARNTLWALGTWKTKQLDAWMREQKPDVIFFASGDYVFSYRVVRDLAETYRIPVVVSVVDDYYFYRGEDHSPLAKWNTRVFRAAMERMMKQAAGAVYVHPAMAKVYDQRFGTRGEVLYKAAPSLPLSKRGNTPPRITYLGSLGLKRHEALIEAGRLLSELTSGTVLLDVYAPETRPEILKELTESNGIRFHGAVSPEDVARIEGESDILLLAESRSPELTERLRYSLSTKVPEYLGSGRCMVAYGPREAGSISYLLDEGDLCVATTAEELEECLREVLFSEEKRRSYAAKQQALAEKNHTAQRSGAVLREILESAAQKRPK